MSEAMLYASVCENVIETNDKKRIQSRGAHTHMQFSEINSEMCMLLIYSGLFSLIEIQTSDTDLMEPFEMDLKSKIIEFMVSII